MDTKIALLVLFNHRFDRNISRINEIYKNRFSYIYHIMPFYNGDIDNVIPVYESSYYFSGYIAQAYSQLKNKGFTHYFIVADDMILNPCINENNIFQIIGLKENECLLPKFWIMHTMKRFWTNTEFAVKYNMKQNGVQVEKILPSIEDAKRQFDKYNLPYGRIPFKALIPYNILTLKTLVKALPFTRTLNYPLVGGYSDMFMVPADTMKNFSLYCGAFSATKLWVELAIPTSMVLSSDNIKVCEDLGWKCGDMWETSEISRFEEYYGLCLKNLINNFPNDVLYCHPVKLTRWN